MSRLRECLLLVGFLGLLPDFPAKGEPPKQASNPSHTDLYGDPLPERAIARLGSIHLRHPRFSELVFPGNGNTFLTIGKDRTYRYWDLTTGKQVQSTWVSVAEDSRTQGGCCAGCGKLANSLLHRPVFRGQTASEEADCQFGILANALG